MQPNEIIRTNLELVATRAPDLTHRFYERLFATHPAVKSMFGRRSQAAQEKMLLDALVAVVDHLEDARWLETTLRALGAKHVEYGVRDEMYPLVADTLVATLADVSAEAWAPEVETAWRAALGFVATTMIAGAREHRATLTPTGAHAAVSAS